MKGTGTMELIRCRSSQFEEIADFYKYVIDNTPNMEQYGRWVYGQHPTDEMILSYVNSGYMYYVEDKRKIIAAVALTPFQTSDYHEAAWSADLDDDEVLVVHILCVDPKLQGTGVSKRIMDSVIELAGSMNMKAVRLDALCCNEPAKRLYEKCGFTKGGTQNWYADNTGWIDFCLYEYVLK